MVEKAETYQQTIGDFKVIKTLGKGGNAIVKLVENAKKEQFALKIFEPVGKKKKEEIIADMEVELQLVQTLNISSIPKYYEINGDATWTKKDGCQK